MSGLLLSSLVLTHGSIGLRDLVGGSVPGYASLLVLLNCGVTLPLEWYRSYRLEREYALSLISAREWWRDYAKTAVLSTGAGLVAVECVHFGMRASPVWWWLIGAAAASACLVVLTILGPVLLLPMFHRFRPLDHERLRQRLLALCARAGVPVLSVHQWGIGERTRRANAALVGAGATRRILISDTLMAEYTEDEIEVVLAHEIGHHVHRDVANSLILELLVLLAAFFAASVALDLSWQSLGFRSPDDVAAIPVIALAAGAVVVAATPLLNAWSRRNERRADRFALALTSRPEAFVAAVRRMAAQNLAEERPTLAARWFFATHPGVEERVGSARERGV